MGKSYQDELSFYYSKDKLRKPFVEAQQDIAIQILTTSPGVSEGSSKAFCATPNGSPPQRALPATNRINHSHMSAGFLRW
jgi:hypothetical protein